jgi:hypothetical protein
MCTLHVAFEVLSRSTVLEVAVWVVIGDLEPAARHCARGVRARAAREARGCTRSVDGLVRSVLQQGGQVMNL